MFFGFSISWFEVFWSDVGLGTTELHERWILGIWDFLRHALQQHFDFEEFFPVCFLDILACFGIFLLMFCIMAWIIEYNSWEG